MTKKQIANARLMVGQKRWKIHGTWPLYIYLEHTKTAKCIEMFPY